MMEKLRTGLHVKRLWYAAFEMTHNSLTPVLPLNGLSAVQKCFSALDHFDASGDYEVFAPLLCVDGVPDNPELDKPLLGASALFF